MGGWPHGEVVKDSGSFSTEVPADLDPDNKETCPSCGFGLGVHLAPLAASGGYRRPGRPRHDLGATCIANGNIDVHAPAAAGARRQG